MSRLATTPGNRLVMPCSSTAYGTPPAGAGICGPSSLGRDGAARLIPSPPDGGTPPSHDVVPGRLIGSPDPGSMRRSTRAGPGSCCPGPPRHVRRDVSRSRLRRNLDLAVDDLL